MNQPRNHTLVISGLLGALGPLVGNGLYSGAPSTDGDAILKEFHDGLPAIGYVALPLELLGFAALAVFLSCLVVKLYAVAPVAAVTTAIAGSAMVAVKVGSAAPWMVVLDDADTMDAATAHTLIALNDMAFVVSGFLFSLAFAAAGIGLLRTDTSRFLAWWPVVMGVLGVVAGIIGVAKPDNYLPIPFVLLLVWMIALAIATAMRPTSSPANGANTAYSHAGATE
jgi:hypothetical protein